MREKRRISGISFGGSDLFSGGRLMAGPGVCVNNVRQRQSAERLLAGSAGFFKDPHHRGISIWFRWMPRKKEINHLTHGDLIGACSQMKAPPCCRVARWRIRPRQAAAESWRFQLLRGESVLRSVATAIHCQTVQDSRVPSVRIAAVLEMQARPQDSFLSESIVRNVINPVSGFAHWIV